MSILQIPRSRNLQSSEIRFFKDCSKKRKAKKDCADKIFVRERRALRRAKRFGEQLEFSNLEVSLGSGSKIKSLSCLWSD